MRLKSIILVAILATLLQAESPQWVFFDTKSAIDPIQTTPELRARLERAGHVAGDPYDLPVNPAYVQTIAALGAEVRHVSRWFNAVSIEAADPAMLSAIRALPFVTGIQPVAVRPALRDLRRTPPTPAVIDYGASLDQLEMLEVPVAHAQGLDGRGIRIAVFDAGFRTLHPVFAEMDIAATYDFVDHEENPEGVGDGHGIQVLSVIGGYSADELVGPAFGATYLLARTENDVSESRGEEDNWVAAMEWADSLGVDIITSSLVYREFDDPADNYGWQDMDGVTTLITQATTIAAQRGILVVNSMGNEGPGSTSLWAPADGPHVMSVGSVNRDETLSTFSGRGPTADGRIKPDVVALGSTVLAASQNSGYSYVTGTSFAAPLISGAAALVLQANPSLTPDSLIALFRFSGTRSENPDNNLGWGIPRLSEILASMPASPFPEATVVPNPTSSREICILIPDRAALSIESIRYYDILGRDLGTQAVSALNPSDFHVFLPADKPLAAGVILFTLNGGAKTYRGKLLYLPK